MRVRPRIAWVLLGVLCGGCHAHRLEPVAPKRAHPTELDFLIDGKTTIDEVQAALGEPSRRFEHGRILSYRLDKHYEVVPVVRGPDAMSAFWIDGRCAGRWGGYMWRKDPKLLINGVWLLYYLTDDAIRRSKGEPKDEHVLIDHVVVATEYVGPMKTKKKRKKKR